MPFTVKEFPGQIFNTHEEHDEARRKRREVESMLAEKAGEIAQVTAVIVPAPKKLLERKVASLERQISDLASAMEKLARGKAEPLPEREVNKEGLEVGTILQGESRGRKYTLEALDEDYLCSDGTIYQSLSGAALGVSGNRRSGWKFWKDIEGNPIGTITGRFKDEGRGNPFRTERMS